MKPLWLLTILLICGSFLLALLPGVYAMADMVRCLMLAYGCTFVGFLLGRRYHKHAIAPVYYFGVLVLLCYTIVCIDTYLVHSLSWFPGIIRYPLFSTYGVWYLLFCIVGVCLSFYKQAEAIS